MKFLESIWVLKSNYMAQWNLFDVVNNVILKFSAALKFLADNLSFPADDL